jgi:hypothetical protein
VLLFVDGSLELLWGDLVCLPKRNQVAVKTFVLLTASAGMVGLNLALEGYAPTSLVELANAPPLLAVGFALGMASSATSVKRSRRLRVLFS